MSSNNRPTRSQQREEARAKAKAMREQHKKSERRKGFAIKAGIGLAVVAAAAIIASVIIGGLNGSVNANQNETPKNTTAQSGFLIGAGGDMFTASNTPTPKPTTGTIVPSSPVKIVTYVDYQCPYCGYFEKANLAQIKGWLDSGLATLEVRPLSFLDGRGSPNTYSSRAANAAFCVGTYSPSSFFAFSGELFMNQPAEGTAGPENGTLFDTAKKVGISNENSIRDCINNKAYGKYIAKATDSTFKTGVPEYAAGFDWSKHGTPAVFVNGNFYEGAVDNAAAFAQFVQGIAFPSK